MDNTMKGSLHVAGHGKSRRKNWRKAFKDSTELYYKAKRVSDVKATILRKGKELIIIIIINTVNRPDIPYILESNPH